MRKNIQTNTHQFIIEQHLNNSIVITAICEATRLSFRSDIHKMAKINISTIVSALNKDSQQIKYYLTDKEESMIFSIRVQFEFLPIIFEEIILKKLINSQEHLQIQYSQILGEIQELEKKIDQASFQTKIYERYQAVHGTNDLFFLNLQKGVYVLEYSAIATSAGESYIQPCELDDGYGGANSTSCVSFVIVTQSNKNISQRKMTFSYIIYEEYESPAVWTDLIQIEQSTKVIIKLENSPNSWISNSLLVVSKAK